jgi:hypothetical protein
VFGKVSLERNGGALVGRSEGAKPAQYTNSD